MSVRQLILAFFIAVLSGIALAQVTGDDSGASNDDSAATEDDAGLAAEDAEVEKVLSDAELIYGDEDDDFIPSKNVSADQSLDYPVDI
ncbi:MAG: hypothetical protein AAAFM81_12600 [Pseudomonadota bacterium]